jgi:hypothetical protein
LNELKFLRRHGYKSQREREGEGEEEEEGGRKEYVILCRAE